MKKLLIQIHTKHVPSHELTRVLALLSGLVNTLFVNKISVQEKTGKYVNILLETSFLFELWLSIRSILCLDLEDRSSDIPFIITCEGNNGWDDYLLLYHFDKTQILDKVSDRECNKARQHGPEISDRFSYSSKMRLISIAGELPKVLAHIWLMTRDLALISEIDDGFVFNGFSIMPNWKELGLDFDFYFKQKSFYIDTLKIKIPRRLMALARVLNLNDFGSMVDEIRKKNLFIAVHLKSSPDAAWLGAIVKITKKYLYLDSISFVGESMGIMKFKQNDIAKIEFATRYISVFERYCKNIGSANRVV
jgi:hypothetical protein